MGKTRNQGGANAIFASTLDHLLWAPTIREYHCIKGFVEAVIFLVAFWPN
jgi:hypothetical protein